MITYIRDLKYKHPLIYQRALACQVERGNPPNEDIKIVKVASCGGIGWSESEEGFEVWSDVSSGVFDPWYEYWGIMNPESKIEML